jgi:hypothetical protein
MVLAWPECRDLAVSEVRKEWEGQDIYGLESPVETLYFVIKGRKPLKVVS